MTTVQIRRARVNDLEALTRIYNHYVVHTPITFDVRAYSVAERRAWLDGFADRGRHQLFVAEQAGQLLGYAGTTRYRAKAAYDTSVETTIYLDPDAIGRGVGDQLYRVLFEALAHEDVHVALAGITLPNDASIALHRRFGFESSGVLREVGHKLGRYWDVEWLVKRLR